MRWLRKEVLCEHLLFCLSGGVPAGWLLRGAQGAAGRRGFRSAFRWGVGSGSHCWHLFSACLRWYWFPAACPFVGRSCCGRAGRLVGAARTPFTRVPDPDAAALWACVLPLAVVTLYLLHTHVLHLVDGSYHTGQSCYGDMAMHLGFIKNIAVTGKLPPVYPLLGGEHRFGYPFLCETVSSVFLVLGADARTAYLLPMLAAFTSVYGMMWQLARQVLGSAGKACLAFWLFFMGSGFGFVYFLGSARRLPASLPGFTPPPPTTLPKTSSGSTPSWIC